MLLKILLLQVMSIGLITVPIKAQDQLATLPDLYMEDNDKAVMNSIWNMAGFPTDQDAATEVDRKFLATISRVVPVLQQPIVQQIPMVPTYVPGIIHTITPGFTSSVGLGIASTVASRVPSYPGVAGYPYNHHQQFNDNKQDNQIYQAGGTYIGSPTTINYKVLPKPPNSELDSSEEDDSAGLINNRRTLHPENADLEIPDDNEKETNVGYSTDNLETDSQDLNSADLIMEQMERMMQFEGADDNILKNNKPRNFLQRKSQQNMESQDTNTEVDIRSKTVKNNNPPDEENATMNRNSHMRIHKKKHNRKTDNLSRNSETSTHLPTVANHKNTGKRKGSIRKSSKMPETRKYHEMHENNQKYLCKCDIMSDETMKDSKPRRRNRELNDRNSYTERNVDIRHERPFNCTKYCSVTEENADQTKDKDNFRMRSRHDKSVYHKDKRNNVDDVPAEEESVEPKAVHSRKYRNKQTMNPYVDDFNYRSMRNVNPSEYEAGSPVEVLDNVEDYNSMMHQYPKSNLIHYETLKRL
ncbi:hypothetical protein CBL_04388 [Carabus blaptoides fortunei]